MKNISSDGEMNVLLFFMKLKRRKSPLMREPTEVLHSVTTHSYLV